jgi:PleD family two-component response regulator
VLRHSGIHLAIAEDMNGELAIMTHIERTSEHHTAVRPRTVAVVSANPDQHVIETVLGAVDHDVVLVEPTAHAYSHIKHIRPDLVIVCMGSDDSEGCQLLSMLTLDRETSRIPVVTHVIPAEDSVPRWDRSWDNTNGDAMMPVTAAALN